ncbi:hypothetical protein [Hymenobacter weizhouensis]|uniref:hypothetical protein n=1 Tax=Hymenobacter sp. YIM 151500-1 TaxID=2987689 RepID=UPI0022264C9D|nr:hypothetical protein [Hymenobacter sp. YIM 151500-1]UYZ64321.1 hypothetical protein OIS53_05590 [Hymenobacter sp. YIM 151500-1]
MLPLPSTAEAFETVAKEDLLALRFAAADVLATTAERQRRRWEAERATTLGNAYHGKVDIYFQVDGGATKRVQTTVWASDADYLTLKSGAALPLRCVLGIDFY